MSAPITPERFDGLIWGAKAIAARIKRSPDYVRNTLAKLPGSPVRQPDGRNYCAVGRELDEFFQSSPNKPTVAQSST